MVALPQWTKVSVSQVEAWLSCPRYWRYRAIEKMYEPKTPPQARGDDIHDVFENYQKKLPYESSPYAGFIEKAKQYLPEPGTSHAELKFDLPTYDGGPIFTGFIDLLVPIWNPVHAMDYKTLSDARYMKTPEEIKTNRQLVTYAYAALELGHAKGEIEISHLYCLVTKAKELKPKVLPPVKALLAEADVRRAWYEQLETVKQMQAAVATPTQELPPNTESCTKYNRPCFYTRQCGFDSKPNTNLFRIRGAPMDTPTTKGPTFLEKLNAMKANGNAAAPVATAPSNVLDASEVTIQANGSVVLRGKAASLVLGSEVPNGQIFLTGKDVIEKAGFVLPAPAAVVAAAPATGVLPPDAPSRETPIGAPDPLLVTNTPSTATEAQPEAPKKRGRKKKEGAAAAPVATPVNTEPTAANVPAPVQTAVPSPTPTARPVPRLGLILYVDCYPVKRGADAEDTTLFEDWMSSITERVARENNVADYRLIQYYAKPLLEAEIRRCIVSVPPVMVVNSMSVGAHEALNVLIPYATSIVRALKG